LTSNLPFGDWGEFIGNNAIATATLDRLLDHSMVFSLNGNSYRMKITLGATEKAKLCHRKAEKVRRC
jgi:DNA replication protein DnaC